MSPGSRIYSFLLLVVISALLLLLSCSDKVSDDVLAKIGDEEIRMEDFIAFYELQARPGARPGTFEERKRFLQRMVENRLLALYGYENGYQNDTHIIHQLKAIEKELLIQELYRKKVAGKIQITDEELRQGFLRSKTKVRARHLFCKTREQADSLLKLLQHGSTFQELSKDLFHDTTLARNGGDLGYFTFGDMDENFENAAYSLKIGEISQPIKTRWGYHIIKVEDRKTVPIISESEFQSGKSKIEKIIYQRKEAQLANEYVKNLMKNKNVVVKADAVNFLVRVAKKIKKRSEKLVPEDFPEMEDDEIKSIQREIESHYHETIVEFSGGSWDIQTFLEKIAETLPRDRPDLTSHLDIAEKIAIMLRNDFLVRKAREEKLDKLPHIRRRLRNEEKRLIANLVRLKIMDEINPDSSDYLEYYYAHPGKFSAPEKFQISEIVLSDSSAAQEIYRKIVKGADFSELARQYSERKISADRGGELGIINAVDHPHIAAVLRNMKEGEVSPPVSISGKFFIIKLERRIPPAKLPFAEVEDMVKTETRNMMLRNRIQEICEQMKKKNHVQMNEAALRKLDEDRNPVQMIGVR